MELLLDLTNYRKYTLRDYTTFAKIGIYDREKLAPQKVVINVDAYALLQDSSSTSDNINEVINYSFIRRAIKEIIEKGHIELQETLCDRIVEKLLQHGKIHAVRVSTEKMEAYKDCKSAGVERYKTR
jgi:dihydroneopterin aldolase